MSFVHEDVYYPCALIHWFTNIGEQPDKDTGMWLVRPLSVTSSNGVTDPKLSVIHTDTIVCAAHLMPFFGKDSVPHHVNHTNSLDKFSTFYVNKFVDHHANEIAF